VTDNLLIIEDEHLLALEMQRRLSKAGWLVTTAEDLAGARRLLEEARLEPLVVLADMSLPDGSSLDLLEELKGNSMTSAEWVFLTAYGTIADSVRAVRLGAYDFLEKPYDEARLDMAVQRAGRSARAQQRLLDETHAHSRRYAPESFLGASPLAVDTRRMLAQIGQADFSALIIRGATGTGKGLAARILHYSGPRADGPLVEVNCAALPADLLESELFGHEAGAFTGAKGQRRGLFEQAHGGSLFLDEIGELPLGLQAKLLTAVEDRRVRRVGGSREIQVSVQIIAASNRDLEREVAEGRFRSDLYHRLSVFQIQLPALAQRSEDVETIAWAFIEELNARSGRHIKQVPERVWDALRAHPWPGNVRELRNVIERCVLLSQGQTLDPRWLLLGPAPAPSAPTAVLASDCLCFPLDGSLTMEQMERRIIESALERRGGNVTQAGRLLGMTRQTMRYRVEKYGLRAYPDDE
jgi:DNA-binding NtrC family response regulator